MAGFCACSVEAVVAACFLSARASLQHDCSLALDNGQGFQDRIAASSIVLAFADALVSLASLVRWAGAAFVMIGIAGAAFGKFFVAAARLVLALADASSELGFDWALGQAQR